MSRRHPSVLLLAIVAATVTVLPGPGHAQAEPEVEERTLSPFADVGQLPVLEAKTDGRAVPLPLKSIGVDLKVTGFVARAKVTQRYENPHETPIEAIYTFPLPENAAVDDFRMTIGERVIEGVVQKRAEARQTYEAAKRRGNTAALLEQQRPNIFTQEIANLAPGEAIEVTVRYVQTLAYDDGTFELSFPTTIGPRFFPGAPTGHEGDGVAPDTTAVPDASKVSPPYLPEGVTPPTLELTVDLDAGVPIEDVVMPSHDVEMKSEGDTRLSVKLASHDRVPNRDFIMRWQVAGDALRTSVFRHKDSRGGFVSMMIIPPKMDVDALVGDRELVFVIDVSGSMSGLPLYLAKEAMADALSRLRPRDTFNVITFAGATRRAFRHSVRASPANVETARNIIDGLTAGGGTMMANAIPEALSTEGFEAGRNRHVIFMTDGFIGNEQQIHTLTAQYVEAAEAAGLKARVFGLGIGSSINRELIAGIGRAGKGLALYASNREDPTVQTEKFFHLIDHPILENVKLDWGDLPVNNVEPARIPDVFATRPVIVHARYSGSGKGTVVLSGETPRGARLDRGVKVRLPARGAHQDALPSLWARARVGRLMDSLWRPRGNAASVKEKVERLGTKFRLVTAYTSFVAVDKSRVVGDGNPKKVVQPVAAPEDVDLKAAGGVRYPMTLKSTRTMHGRASGASYGAAGLGMRGTGAGGGGVGYGMGSSLGAKRSAHVPQMRTGSVIVTGAGKGGGRGRSSRGIGGLGTAGHGGGSGSVVGGVVSDFGGAPRASSVSGSLSKEPIQRIIRRHQAEVKYCYEKELRKDPTLAGKLVVRFTITADGSVKSAKITRTSMHSAAVENCLVSRVKRWKFPQPQGGGEVTVSYPFVFTAKGGGTGAVKPAPAKVVPKKAATEAAPEGFSGVEVKGALSKRAVRGALTTGKPAFDRCWDRTRASQATASGIVGLSLSLDASGAVTGVRVTKDTVGVESHAGCLKNAAKGLTFPKSDDGGAVTVGVEVGG